MKLKQIFTAKDNYIFACIETKQTFMVLIVRYEYQDPKYLNTNEYNLVATISYANQTDLLIRKEVLMCDIRIILIDVCADVLDKLTKETTKRQSNMIVWQTACVVMTIIGTECFACDPCDNTC